MFEFGKREVGNGVALGDGVAEEEDGIGSEGERGDEGRTVNGEEGEIGSGGESEMKRKAQGSGLAEGLFDPI